MDRVVGGETVALVSDAGTPGVSDPGAEVVNLAYERGIEPDAIPGPSAISNALALSGFFAQRYVFLGFLPRRAGAAKAELAKFSASTMPIVLFERPSRIRNLLSSVLEVLGDRRVAVCREMTKVHQEVIRGAASEVMNREIVQKGEVTIVVEGERRGA